MELKYLRLRCRSCVRCGECASIISSKRHHRQMYLLTKKKKNNDRMGLYLRHIFSSFHATIYCVCCRRRKRSISLQLCHHHQGEYIIILVFCQVLMTHGAVGDKWSYKYIYIYIHWVSLHALGKCLRSDEWSIRDHLVRLSVCWGELFENGSSTDESTISIDWSRYIYIYVYKYISETIFGQVNAPRYIGLARRVHKARFERRWF